MVGPEYNLTRAQVYAEENSTCAKVHVGSLIITPDGHTVYGCNNGVMNCKKHGCRRVRLYGENSKLHRLPSDCDALHSEVDAICKAAARGLSLQNSTIYITRYPCENCARAIGAAGIKHVYYGRDEYLSEYAQLILDNYGVTVEKVNWTEEDDNG